MNRDQQKHCSEIFKKVFLALDGELSFEEEKQFLEHIDTCVQCSEIFKIEKTFKEFLVKNVEKKQMDPSMITSIREHIRTMSAEG